MSPRTVLIVDDETHITHLLGYKFQQAGMQVVIANDGEEGYRAACARRPDLIISDLQMPVLSGFEMCQRLFANPQTTRIPVLMLTAREHKLPSEDLARTNIIEVMSKPFATKALIARATALLEAHGQAARLHQQEEAA